MASIGLAWARVKRLLGIDELPQSGLLRQAYDAGYRSYPDGQNPHATGSDLHRFWKRGYNDHLDEEAKIW